VTGHGPDARAHRLVRFLGALADCADPAATARAAAAAARELVGADAAAVHAGDVRAASGELGADAVVAEWATSSTGRLAVSRASGAFDEEDTALVHAMAEALGLALDRVRAHDRAERQQRVLATLMEIQAAIARGEPLTAVLHAITEGAAALLGRPVRLADDATAPHAAPVVVHEEPAGALVVDVPDGEPFAEQDLLEAFAAHASLALTEARTFEAMQDTFWDPLTGLPTRQLLVDRLRTALRGPDPAVSVLLLHLARFGAVNEVLGRAAGDELLQQVTSRLLDAVTPEATVARLGGGDFAVLLTGAEPGEAEATARDVIAAVEQPFTVHGTLVHVGLSIGVAHGRGGGPEELLSDADVAGYRARVSGSGTVVTYDDEMRAALLDRLEMQAHLQTALERDELALHYQPIVELDTGRSTGVEALIRWTHPARGPVPPSDFIPMAEHTGAIVPIGRWVLRTACREVARWRRFAPDLTMNVNVSALQLRDPSFPADVRAALDESGLPGDALILEITESALLGDDERTLAGLQTLKELGVAVALDDFGTGYSALGYLRRFPVDILKIDRSFVSGDGSDGDGQQLVRTIIELGRAYRLEVVAEGIEDEEQRQRLLALGCRVGQGYHFARPAAPEAIEEHLATVHPLVPRPRPAACQTPGAQVPRPSSARPARSPSS